MPASIESGSSSSLGSSSSHGLLRISLEALREIAGGIERLRQAPDTNQVEHAAQTARQTAVHIEVDLLALAHTRFHSLKLAFERRYAAADRYLRFAQKLAVAEIIHVREDQIAPAPASNGATITAFRKHAEAGRHLARGNLRTDGRDVGWSVPEALCHVTTL